jgi:transposase
VREKNLPAAEPSHHALGRSRGGFGTKLHLLTDGNGLPLNVVVSPGEAHESKFVVPLLDTSTVQLPTGRRRPLALAGDRGYSVDHLRFWLRKHHIRPVIPTRRDQRRQPDFSPRRYRRRNVVERAVGLLKEARRVATRYEKLAVHYLGVLKLAMVQVTMRAAFSDTP